MPANGKDKPWLSYLNLSDHYERKARFVPALLTGLFLTPIAGAFSTPLGGWLVVILSGVGLGAVLAVGLSYLASAAGNRIQSKIWPRWPHDSPTNRWLYPDDRSRSKQQKAKWYEEIKQLTKLDIDDALRSGVAGEVESVINDAVSQLRYRLRNSSHADRLQLHNADYGFARNFAGFRPVWVTFAVLSGILGWCGVALNDASLFWGILGTMTVAGAIALSFMVKKYVVVRANAYAESFFGAMSALAEGSN